MAWHMAADINWVALYRAGVGFLLMLVVGLIGYQSSRIISRQDELYSSLGGLRTEMRVEQRTVMALTETVAKNAAAVHDGEKRLNRTNDRQIEMSKTIAVIESQLMDLRAVRR